MALDCVITIPGTDQGARGNGAPKLTKVGPVHDFLKDSEHYYRAVWKHVKECGTCDPADVLRGFLANRDARQFGQTSTMLVEMAEKYRRHFGERIPEELVREFIIRSATSWETFEDRISRLSPEEIVRAHDLYVEAWRKDVLKSATPRAPRRKGGRKVRRSWPFARGQGVIGWLNDKSQAHLGRVVPLHTRKAAALTREAAMANGGWDLMAWLITRHSWETALADPDVQYVMAVELAEEVMEA